VLTKASLDESGFNYENQKVMSFLESPLNLVAFLFWFAFWNPNSREIFFNPYVLKIRTVADGLIESIKPVFGRHLSRRAVAGSLLLVILVIKGLLYYSGLRGHLVFGIDSSMPGVERQVLTPYAPQLTDVDLSFAPMTIFAAKIMLFSCATFGVFVFKVWGVAMIYLGTSRATGLSRAQGTLFSLARPLTSIAPEFRPLFLLGLGIVIVAARVIFVRGLFPFEPEHCLVFFAKAFLSTVAAWVDILPLIVNILWALIVGSWIALFSMSAPIGLICREWLDLFLGPLRNRPIHLGGMDLSPIVLAFVLGTLARFLQHLILTSYAILQ
jgi:uncharacterized protein YggT (Ycf19 family)